MSRTGLINFNAVETHPVVGVWEGIASARRQLAAAWLGTPGDHAEATASGELGKLHRLIAETGIRSQIESSLDEPMIREFTGIVAENEPINPGSLLAATLYLYPHQFQKTITLGQIPEFLLDVYLRYSLDTPTLLKYPGEAEDFARYLAEWLQYLHEKVKANHTAQIWRNIANLAAMSINPIPAYFASGNLRDLMTSRARLIEQALKFNQYPIDASLPPRGNRNRIRLGILSAHYMPHTETFATLPVFRYLDRQKFEVILLTTREPAHPLERFCASLADKFITLPPTLAAQIPAVRELDLDILWIGSNITAVTKDFTLLCAHRLARMQVSSVCSCVTSGFKNIDYYVSGKLSEPANGAQEHYAEKLLLIDGPAHCYDFAADSDAEPAIIGHTRAELNIDENSPVFASGANFFKILPELDDVWARILAAVPGSRLLLYPFNPNWTSGYPVRPFLQRMRTNMARHGVAMDRLAVFEPAPNRSEVLARLAVADVYLDSFPFAGATSLLDPLQLKIPSVVMDGTTFRSLVGPALLREMKLDEFIAHNVDAYINLAVKLGSDESYRAAAKKKFAGAMSQTPGFLDGKWYAGEISRLLTDAWNAQSR